MDKYARPAFLCYFSLVMSSLRSPAFSTGVWHSRGDPAGPYSRDFGEENRSAYEAQPPSVRILLAHILCCSFAMNPMHTDDKMLKSLLKTSAHTVWMVYSGTCKSATCRCKLFFMPHTWAIRSTGLLPVGFHIHTYRIVIAGTISSGLFLVRIMLLQHCCYNARVGPLGALLAYAFIGIIAYSTLISPVTDFTLTSGTFPHFAPRWVDH